MRNTLTNIIRRWDDLLKLKNHEMILPSFVDLHTSNRCNQKCRGCAYAGMLDGSIMNEKQHFTAVKLFLLHLGVKAFDFAGGGEASLIPYLPELMACIRENGGHFALITNGVNMPDQLIEQLVKGATYVRFSLEATDPYNYSKYKGVNSWDKVIDNILRLKTARGRRRGGCEISLKFSVGNSLRGAQHYFAGIRLGEELGVDRINFAALTHEPEELTRVERDMEERLLQGVLGHNAELRAKVHYWIASIPFNEVPQCWMTPTHTVMDWEGNLYSCCYYYYRKEQMFLGNIFERGFAPIWFSKDHWDKIAGIKREDCAKVRCKFFLHHKAFDDAFDRGHGYFL